MTEFIRCTKCEVERARAEFDKDPRKRNGLKSTCKECGRTYSREWTRKNRKRNAEKAKAWREANPTRVRKATRKWQRENMDLVVEQGRKYRAADPERYRAHNRLSKAVSTGKLAKPSKCERCLQSKTSRQLDGHHRDYSKPLEVQWLCRQCHKDRHREEQGEAPKTEPASPSLGFAQIISTKF